MTAFGSMFEVWLNDICSYGRKATLYSCGAPMSTNLRNTCLTTSLVYFSDASPFQPIGRKFALMTVRVGGLSAIPVSSWCCTGSAFCWRRQGRAKWLFMPSRGSQLAGPSKSTEKSAVTYQSLLSFRSFSFFLADGHRCGGNKFKGWQAGRLHCTRCSIVVKTPIMCNVGNSISNSPSVSVRSTSSLTIAD